MNKKRFEQYKKYETFKDLESIDHGDLGAEILENDIRKYIETDQLPKDEENILQDGILGKLEQNIIMTYENEELINGGK